ncbi:hypothetical protein BBD42_30125 [Paenibacillus sp. BIHB 4019]|uniref:PhnB-like domain-containing protein n=1 Tax=Paenibacillus sp. BIHB 4019 TaxID=1870819 RepID=A0A1B2DRD9_9BACL|nr:VOC family protein [Paenibacillus sp. BIHB 4019]ANY70279.1 hypothetical protein BBD42_30125 [Paenibacillus sp. BIHB 4019]
MEQKVFAFLMFSGQADEAMKLYVSAFEDAGIVSAKYYPQSEPGAKPKVLHAIFSIKGQQVMCIDNQLSDSHPHAFTPALSLFVNCDSEAEINEVFAKLAEDGKVLMPLSPSPVSTLFGWLEDKYGVSWQLNLPAR